MIVLFFEIFEVGFSKINVMIGKSQSYLAKSSRDHEVRIELFLFLPRNSRRKLFHFTSRLCLRTLSRCRGENFRDLLISNHIKLFIFTRYV